MGASAPDTPGIVHIGLGSFHRAHAAVYTAQAMANSGGDWGVLGVGNRSRGVVDPLARQDHLYSVLELSPEGERADVLDVHRGTLVAAEQTDELLDAIAANTTRVVTLTISEHGYQVDASTGRLAVDSDAVRADLASEQPKTTIGQLAVALRRRYERGGEPISILSCDNMQSAGHLTRDMVLQYMDAAKAPTEVQEWAATSVSFPNAMVDRIVPGTTDETRHKVQELLGVRDAIPVPAERFTMWVIEDEFAGGRPDWESAGAIFTDEVEKYELVKLRLLNGSHSLISYLGGLDQQPTIPHSRDQEFIAASVDAALRQEYLPSIDLPSGFDPESYMAQLFDRWRNHALGDRTSRVGSDGSAKLLQRVPLPALRMLDMGQMPHQLALTVAGWIACVAPPTGFAPGPVADAMLDPARDRLAKTVAGAASSRAHAEAIMRGGFFPEELAARDEFTSRVADFLELIVADGVRAAAADALAAGQRS